MGSSPFGQEGFDLCNPLVGFSVVLAQLCFALHFVGFAVRRCMLGKGARWVNFLLM